MKACSCFRSPPQPLLLNTPSRIEATGDLLKRMQKELDDLWKQGAQKDGIYNISFNEMCYVCCLTCSPSDKRGGRHLLKYALLVYSEQSDL